jgi:hypothetical protein
MSDAQTSRAWIDQVTTDTPRAACGIPLIGFDQLDLKDASAAPLISVLADIILSTCVTASAVVPETHASAA